MKQFGKILNFELKNYLKNKAFVGVTLLLVVIIAVVMFFPRITSLFESGDPGDSTADLPVLLVKAEDPAQAEMVHQTFAAAFVDYDVQVTDKDTSYIKDQITSGNAEGAFVMTGPTSYTYYVNNLSMYDANEAIANEVLQQIYQMNAMIGSGMTPEQAEEVMNIQVTSQVEMLGKDQMQNFFYTYIMIFALYMVILLYGQMVAMNVATEKSSRAMEVLITSAKPTSMMFGKVLASCLAGFIQIAAVFGSALVLYHINRDYWAGNPLVQSLFNIPPELFAYMLIFFVLGFLIYAFLFGALGSTATKLEDINTSTMPLILLFVAAFMVSMMGMSSGNVDSTLMKVCSFVPFTSPMAMFTRIAMSTVPMHEILLSIAILAVSSAGIGVLAAKIYRVGVLLYGTTPKLGAILKAIRKA